MDKLQNAILERSIPEPNSGCWLWLNSLDDSGYGRIKLDGVWYRASRASFIAFKYDPGKLFVLHSCDNRTCVNPDHLFLGTQKDNIQDMVSKGRRFRINAKLNAENISSIRLDKRSAIKISKDYNVSANTIRLVRRGLTYKDL